MSIRKVIIPSALAVLVIAAILPTAGFTLTEERYYRADVAVRSQARSERQYGAQKGLSEVLVRMSGTDKVLESEAIQQQIGRALNFVDQFQYRRLDDEALLEEGFRETLVLSFSAKKVKEVLQNNEQNFWPTRRPSTLVWLVEDDLEAGKRLATQELSPEIFKALQDASVGLGLPLSWPLLDMEDQLVVTAEGLWRLDEEMIAEASQRYPADVILVGRYTLTSRGEYRSTWQYSHRGQSQLYDISSPEIPELVVEALKPLRRHLADLYSVKSGGIGASAMAMRLVGVGKFAHYRKALNYLESIAAISSVSVEKVADDELQLLINSEVTVEKLKNIIALDTRLIEVENTPNPVLGNEEDRFLQFIEEGSYDNPLHYRWAAGEPLEDETAINAEMALDPEFNQGVENQIKTEQEGDSSEL